MPPSSESQRRFMGARLSEQRATGSNSTGMNESQLRDFARKPARKASRKGVKRGGRSRY